jgi:hypothetical protein
VVVVAVERHGADARRRRNWAMPELGEAGLERGQSWASAQSGIALCSSGARSVVLCSVSFSFSITFTYLRKHNTEIESRFLVFTRLARISA